MSGAVILNTVLIVPVLLSRSPAPLSVTVLWLKENKSFSSAPVNTTILKPLGPVAVIEISKESDKSAFIDVVEVVGISTPVPGWQLTDEWLLP